MAKVRTLSLVAYYVAKQQPGKRFYVRENNEPSVCVQSLLDNGSNNAGHHKAIIGILISCFNV